MGILDRFRRKEVSYYTADPKTLKKIVKNKRTELDFRVNALARLVELEEVQPNVESIVKEIGMSPKEAEKVCDRFTYLMNLGKARMMRMKGQDDLADEFERELDLNNGN